MSVTHRKNIITHNKESVPDFELKFFIYIYEIMKREIISMELFRKVYFKTRKEEINKQAAARGPLRRDTISTYNIEKTKHLGLNV